jgi:RNA-directed DNA polymerase
MMHEFPLTKALVGSRRDLEHRLGVKREVLLELIKSRNSLYRPFERPKKQHPYPGKLRRLKASQPLKVRRIDNPVKQLKDIQKRILKSILTEVGLPPYMFGAIPGKTLVHHAEKHLANQASTVVRMDISSYYPNITCLHVYFVWNFVLGCPPPVAKMLTELTTFEWHLPQGAPTSPAIANILLASIYPLVCLASNRAGLRPTTWVDDLIFSGTAAREVMEPVRAILASKGFKIAPEKREIMGPRDEKVITGGRLGRFCVRAPHNKMSELRAAIHRLAIGSVDEQDLDKYRQNLAGRIAHIASIHPGDAAKLRRQMVKLRVSLN